MCHRSLCEFRQPQYGPSYDREFRRLQDGSLYVSGTTSGRGEVLDLSDSTSLWILPSIRITMSDTNKSNITGVVC